MPKHDDLMWQGISRVDHKHTHGWLARIYLTGRRTITKLFSDLKCGGREVALEQARQWRATYPVAEQDRPKPRKYLTTKPKNNTTGRVGVSQGIKNSRNGEPMRCFQVCWVPEPYHAKNKTFYWSSYGSEAAAFEAACAFRAEMERELDKQRR